MNPKKIKTIQVTPQDFSSRTYFPGTPGHPFHTIDKIHAALVKVPFPIFAVVFGGLVFLLDGSLAKPLLITGFVLLDWLLLRFLPVFRISFGPPTLTALILGMMRAPFLLFNFPTAFAFQVLGSLLIVYGFYIEPQFPKVSTYQVKITNEGAKKRTIRIAHLSDLHMEFFTSREARAVAQINALHPDLILFSGDFLNLSYQEDQQSLHDIAHFFNQLKAEYGIFGITGSPSVDIDESISKLIPNLNLTLLSDQIVELTIHQTPIQIIGLACTHQPDRDLKRLEKLFHVINDVEVKTRLLLYHSPDIAPLLGSLPIEIQFSGHTHGGQVQIPFLGPIYTGSLYGYTFSSGHYFVNELHHLIISRGLGLEGEAAPRVRFFSPPEIGLISLEISPHHVK